MLSMIAFVAKRRVSQEQNWDAAIMQIEKGLPCVKKGAIERSWALEDSDYAKPFSGFEVLR